MLTVSLGTGAVGKLTVSLGAGARFGKPIIGGGPWFWGKLWTFLVKGGGPEASFCPLSPEK